MPPLPPDLDLLKVKEVLRSALLSSPKAFSLAQLARDYESIEDQELPYKQFGYSSLTSFLRSIPDTVRLVMDGYNNVTVLPVIDSSLAHLEDMVGKQRKNKVWGPLRGRAVCISSGEQSQSGPHAAQRLDVHYDEPRDQIPRPWHYYRCSPSREDRRSQSSDCYPTRALGRPAKSRSPSPSWHYNRRRSRSPRDRHSRSKSSKRRKRSSRSLSSQRGHKSTKTSKSHRTKRDHRMRSASASPLPELPSLRHHTTKPKQKSPTKLGLPSTPSTGSPNHTRATSTAGVTPTKVPDSDLSRCPSRQYTPPPAPRISDLPDTHASAPQQPSHTPAPGSRFPILHQYMQQKAMTHASDLVVGAVHPPSMPFSQPPPPYAVYPPIPNFSIYPPSMHNNPAAALSVPPITNLPPSAGIPGYSSVTPYGPAMAAPLQGAPQVSGLTSSVPSSAMLDLPATAEFPSLHVMDLPMSGTRALYRSATPVRPTAAPASQQTHGITSQETNGMAMRTLNFPATPPAPIVSNSLQPPRASEERHPTPGHTPLPADQRRQPPAQFGAAHGSMATEGASLPEIHQQSTAMLTAQQIEMLCQHAADLAANRKQDTGGGGDVPAAAGSAAQREQTTRGPTADPSRVVGGEQPHVGNSPQEGVVQLRHETINKILSAVRASPHGVRIGELQEIVEDHGQTKVTTDQLCVLKLRGVLEMSVSNGELMVTLPPAKESAATLRLQPQTLAVAPRLLNVLNSNLPRDVLVLGAMLTRMKAPAGVHLNRPVPVCVAKTELRDPGHFFLHYVGKGYSRDLNKLMIALGKLYSDQVKCIAYQVNASAVYENMYVATKYMETWHRALVLKKHGPHSVTLIYIDYGTVETKNVQDLYYLQHDFGQLAPQAVLARLHNILPIASDLPQQQQGGSSSRGASWPDKASAEFQALMKTPRDTVIYATVMRRCKQEPDETQLLQVSVVGQQPEERGPETLDVELTLTAPDGTKSSISSWMVEQGLARFGLPRAGGN